MSVLLVPGFYLIFTTQIFYSGLSFHSITMTHTKGDSWNSDGAVEASMTVRNQLSLHVLIDGIIKTVLSWLRNVFRFVSITKLFAGLAEPTVGNVCEINVEEGWTDNIQQVSID